jgi:hypothetical protein
MRTDRLLVSLLAAALLAGCASRPINEPITQVDPQAGYRPQLLIPKRQNNQLSTLFVLSFSGGGTRAAAFSYGVLEELRRTEIVVDGQRRRMIDEVDVITGVSGGSFHGALVRPLWRPAILRVRSTLPQARRARRADRPWLKPFQLVEIRRRQRRALGAGGRVLRRNSFRGRDFRRSAGETGAGGAGNRDRPLQWRASGLLPE